MKIITKTLSLLLISIILVSCGSSMNAVWQKENYTKHTFKNIAVIALSKNLEARQEIESAIISEISKQNPNIKLVSGLAIFPPNVDMSKLNEDKVEAALKEQGIDAVITTSMINSYQTQDISGGNSYYYPTYHRVGRYVFRTYNQFYDYPTYETDQNFVLQSNLFDLSEGDTKEDVLVWQGQSTVVNPSSIASAAESYAKDLVSYLAENAFISQ